MTKAPRKSYSAADLARAASDAANVGNGRLAMALLTDALALERKRPDLLLARAGAAVLAGEVAAAAVDLTQVLRLKPGEVRAARQLSTLAATVEIEAIGDLEPAGLMAALNTSGIALQPIARLAMRFAFDRDPATRALLAGPTAAIEPGAAALVVPRLTPALGSDLLQAALAHGLVQDEASERLLTGARSALLALGPAELLAHPDAFKLAVAMLPQMWRSDHAWFESAADTARLAAIGLDRTALAAGDAAAGAAVLLWLLFRPLAEVPGGPLDAAIADGVRPKPLRALLLARIASDTARAEREKALPAIAPLSDATSRRVAAQYEAAPYPRWTSLQAPQPGSLLPALQRFAPADGLSFLAQPFDVLIAGAGTGQQAIRARLGYGDKARVTAIDLSRASLGYGASMADRFGAADIDWRVGDIADLDHLAQSYDVIECVGVLHHMADPMSGWRSLLRHLKPHGLMYIGLYSATSRSEITALRQAAEWPGAGCSDAVARGYRRRLLDLAEGLPGAGLRHSRNFYALAEMRDLVLHEQETVLTLPELAGWLDRLGLRFLGFTLPEHVWQGFAGGADAGRRRWPGDLADWDHFESQHPRTFDGMYCFWCARA